MTHRVKILVTLPQSIVGGADVSSINTFQALRMIGYDVSPLIFPYRAKPHFVNYLKRSNLLLKSALNNYLNSYSKVIVIATYLHPLYHILDLKRLALQKSLCYGNLVVTISVALFIQKYVLTAFLIAPMDACTALLTFLLSVFHICCV